MTNAYHGRPVSPMTMDKIAMALDVKLAELDTDATECQSVRSMTDAAERPSETLGLTPLRCDILVLVANGLTNCQIAGRLGLTPGLVGTHIGNITRELAVTSRAELAAVGTGRGMPR